MQGKGKLDVEWRFFSLSLFLFLRQSVGLFGSSFYISHFASTILSCIHISEMILQENLKEMEIDIQHGSKHRIFFS